MGFWLSWNVEDNVKMQVFVDNAAAANKESPCSGLKECPAVVRHGSKRKLEEEEAEMDSKEMTIGVGSSLKNNRNSRVYVVHRQSIFNISMCKLNRYRQAPDPSLRRSVLICNTLRTIEREMVSEGISPSPPVPTLPSIETDKMTLDPLPSSTECYPSPSPSSYFSGAGNVVTAVEAVSCRDNNCELGYEKSLTDLDSISGRATPYPSSNNSNNNIDLNQSRSPCKPSHRLMWESTVETSSSNSSPPSSSSSSELVSDRVQVSTTTISWSSVLSFPSQNELVTTNSSVSEDVWPANSAYFETEVSSNGAESGGPNTSPSASSDSGISTASDEIFGDIDLSLYDFDLLPLSPPNTRAPTAEELLRSFPPTGQSIQLTSPIVTTSSAMVTANSVLPFNSHSRHTRSFEGICEEFDHVMHVMPAPP